MPSRKSFFLHYGWVIILIAAVGHYMSGPGQTYCVMTMVDPMLHDLQYLNLSDYSLAYLVGTIVAGFLLPFSGSLVDRFGARLMIPLAGVLLGLACMWMAHLENLAALYIGFLMLRCFGQGMLPLFSNWLIGEWFEHRRGLAIGVVGIGGAFSTMTVPPIVNYLIGIFDWRYTWMLLAFASWALMIFAPLILIRNRPEGLGLFPDLRFTPLKNPENPQGKNLHQEEVSWSRAEALRDPSFWKLLSVLATSAMVGTGLVFHQVSLLQAHGVSRDYAIGLIAIQAGVGTGATLVFGYLTDRLASQYLMGAAMLLLAIDTLLLIYLPTPYMAILYAVIMGFFGGIMRSTGQIIWVNFYGRKNQGAVCGAAFSVGVIASGLGPLTLAWAKQLSGSFHIGLWIFLAMPIFSAAYVFTAKKPVKQ